MVKEINSYTVDQLFTQMLNNLDPSDHSVPEIQIIQATILALPSGDYALYDSVDGEYPQWLFQLDGPIIATWDGTAPNSFGYGSIKYLDLDVGKGLTINAWGRHFAGSIPITIIPVSCDQYTTHQ
jgi:hypothetical protein